jgi:hypothetical protein
MIIKALIIDTIFFLRIFYYIAHVLSKF